MRIASNGRNNIAALVNNFIFPDDWCATKFHQQNRYLACNLRQSCEILLSFYVLESICTGPGVTVCVVCFPVQRLSLALEE